ncbi:hypothetical protein EB796_011046 [Bugula neritina]|uniref:Laminin EGF-like domain-containing protein n=1 Tax=Bugula neritina TaxID=10212 RepID=A0A7J7JW44_BUGNE|nr:hypothetical protein EB796_011046 [Bugula neritina]
MRLTYLLTLLIGYYGDPSLGSEIPCSKCMCPGGEGSGYQHASTCSLDQRTKAMICDCPPEFAGDRCEECAINHYGNPLVANGTCTSCLEGCNYSIDMEIPGSCDADTGRCLKCQYDTEGDSCERCAKGFHGNAVEHSCVACTCNWLGADRNATEPCNRQTGQCPCLPNVIGESCDQCAQDHWKLASGVGCEPCMCDNEGSLSPQCNEFDGQCQCIAGRGGKRCDQCPDLYYGDPVVQCFACDCNPDGSETLQCDPTSGQCVCLEGITGLKCDRCDRGTTGDLPNCVPCGECFDNWDSIVKTLRERTNDMLVQVNVTKSQGAVGVFDEQFQKIEDTLEKIQMIINNFNKSEASLDEMELSLDQIRLLLESAQSEIAVLDNNFKETNKEVAQTESHLSALELQIAELLQFAQAQKIDVDKAVQEDIVGAYKTIQANEQLSQSYLDEASQTKDLVTEALALQNDTIDMLEANDEEFTNKTQENTEALDEFDQQLAEIKLATLEDINKLVCDVKSPFLPDQYCDVACGGGGCGSCGEGNSCTNGAQGKVISAMNTIAQAEDVANNKTLSANSLKKEFEDANVEADVTLAAANESNIAAAAVLEEATSANISLTDTLNTIGEFLGEDKVTPQDVVAVAERVLELNISVELGKIEALANQINETIKNLTNIDQILNETAADLATSEKLKERADNASKAANEILQQVNNLNKKLSDARKAQNDSAVAISNAKEDIAETRESLKAIGDTMTSASKKARALRTLVNNLYVEVKNLGTINTANGQNVDQAKSEAELARRHADQAELDSKTIESNYTGVPEKIAERHNASLSAYERSVALLKRAGQLATSLTSNNITLTTMNKQLEDNEKHMTGLQKEIDRLTAQVDAHIITLTAAETHHSTCEATDTTT